MTSQPSLSTIKKQLRSLPSKRIEKNEIEPMMAELFKQRNDRATALVGAALVEAMITDLLHLHFPHLSNKDRETLFEKDSSPLNAFSAKIKMSFAIGAISSNATTLNLYVV